MKLTLLMATSLLIVGNFFAQERIQKLRALSEDTEQRKYDEFSKVNVNDSLKIKKNLEVLKYVNPFIGTGGHGHTFPGASAPFGMMQLSPDTRLYGWDACSGYHYSDSTIYGFSHTHLSGTGVEDYCDILVAPMIGSKSTIEHFISRKPLDRIISTFKHSNEKASPGYYAVQMDNGISVQLTSHIRSGIHSYIFPTNKEQRFIMIDLSHRDEVLKASFEFQSETILFGSRVSRSWAKNQEMHFAMTFSAPYKSYFFDESKQILVLEYDHEVNTLEIKVGISSVNPEGAYSNLNKEIAKLSFSQLKSHTSRAWAKELQAISIPFDNENIDFLTNFYTALYHSYLSPNIYSDVSRNYRGMDDNIHQLNDKNDQYTVFSLWDTYRATHPWFTLFQKKRTADFIATFVNHFNQSGLLPVWELSANETNCMIGYHAVSVIAEAYLKGIKNIDVPLLLKAIKATTEKDILGRTSFNKDGFLDYKKDAESVSKNLEYSYDSYCVFKFLEQLQKEGYEVTQSDIDIYRYRSFNFINSFDPSTKFMRPRNGGIWANNFKPEEVNFHYTEANSWQYSLYTPHAINVLIDLLGGKKELEDWLDKLFTTNSTLSGNHQLDITGLIGQYAHGNEPSHHMAYLYNYTNNPEKTAVYVDSILHYLYANTPEGLSGNEDCGQMSSWYTFSALGLYPISPVSTIYDFGRPLIKDATLTLENGRRIMIKAINNSKTNKYIQSIKLDGKPYTKRYIAQSVLESSKILEFTMGPIPSSIYRSYETAPSESSYGNFVPAPYFTNSTALFDDKIKVEVKNVNPRLQQYYTLNGTTPSSSSKLYKKAVILKKNTKFKVISIDPLTKKHSTVVENDFFKKQQNANLTLNSDYRQQYAASGKDALIDGIYGGDEYRSGDWQGFYNNNVNGIVTFNKATELNTIGLSALQSTRSWIFPPKKVEFLVTYSDNSVQHVLLELKQIPDSKDAPEKQILFEFTPDRKHVKSIEFTAFNFGPNPEWHQSPGYNTFIFLDELYFK